ncbi:MAG: sigma-70 family RNA polymerase sigma factor [Clostridiales bacterium]|nr:sigma-70 family RNA polymerase sigma factor [Clostridiales bacterium]
MDYYIQTYGRRLFGLCMRLCRNREEAEELYQDTWLRILQSWDSYRPEVPFEPWAARICVNLYRDGLRRLKRRIVTLSFPTWEAQDEAINSAAAPEGEDWSDLYAALDRLPDRLRLPVILYYFNGHDIKETARLLNLPEGTVKSRLARARETLRRWLTDEDGF